MSAGSDIINLLDHDQWERLQAYDDEQLAPLFHLLEQVKDPEIPALSIWDMGILRNITINASDASNPQEAALIAEMQKPDNLTHNSDTTKPADCPNVSNAKSADSLARINDAKKNRGDNGSRKNQPLSSSLTQQHITVVITPTYSGCPAMDLIQEDIHKVLNAAGYNNVTVETQLSPPWCTAWMSDDAKKRMAQSGIAPPQPQHTNASPQCPICGSDKTHKISQFGSTACKALYRCDSCMEPFDYFKAF